ncbi:hypothetical protein LguiA_020318 [Lonicera macranthoides]
MDIYYVRPITLLHDSYMPGAYGTMLLAPSMVPVQNLSPYAVPINPVLSSGTQASVGVASLYGVTKLSSSAPILSGGIKFTGLFLASTLSHTLNREVDIHLNWKAVLV